MVEIVEFSKFLLSETRAVMPLLSTPLAPDNCRQILLWQSKAFPWEVHTNGGSYDGV